MMLLVVLTLALLTLGIVAAVVAQVDRRPVQRVPVVVEVRRPRRRR